MLRYLEGRADQVREMHSFDSVDRVWRFVWNPQGTSSVGYALVLAAIMGIAIAGATMLGSSMDRLLTSFSGGIAPHQKESRADYAVNDHVRSSSSETQAANGSILRIAVFLAVSAAAMVSAGLGWTFLQRDRKPPVEEQPSAQEVVEEKVLLTRLNQKREFLWKQLMEDHNLLLKNQLQARHVMTRKPVVLKKGATGTDIAEVLEKHDVANLVVCDDDMRLLGVVNASSHRASPTAPASKVMSAPSCLIPPDSSLGRSISLLVQESVSFIPVVEKEKLCGVLTPSDLVLTLQCSLQLWFRIAQTMESNAERANALEETSQQIEETADQLKKRVHQLPEQVTQTLKTGNSASLVAEINELTMAVSHLVQQLDHAKSKIRQHCSDMASLRDPSPDQATGTASRDQLEQELARLLNRGAGPNQPLSLILLVADNYQRLQDEHGTDAAEDQLRILAECAAGNISSNDLIGRCGEDTLAIILPGNGIDQARKLASRLNSGMRSIKNCQHRMCIILARKSESAEVLLQRGEAAIARGAVDQQVATV